ncbi:unnamed protein product, partial [Strongylus vulgaris]
MGIWQLLLQNLGGRELTKTQSCNLDIAQKIYDLLKTPVNRMTVREIANRIADKLPEKNDGMTATAKVGMAVKAHSETFSLSALNAGYRSYSMLIFADGIVRIIQKARRPDIETMEDHRAYGNAVNYGRMQNQNYMAERGAPPPPGHPSPHDPVYGNNFENRREEYMPRDWNERGMDDSTRRDPCRQPNNE